MIMTALKKAGFGEDNLDAVHAPIGVPIAARSPEEIAVSIAQLIDVRGRLAAGSASSGRTTRGDLHSATFQDLLDSGSAASGSEGFNYSI